MDLVKEVTAICAGTPMPEQVPPQKPTRFTRQRDIERAIATFNPDTTEAREFLQALMGAVRDRYGDDAVTDVFEHCRAMSDALDELERTVTPYEGPDEMDLSRDAAIESTP
jgi:hypothetical protein